MIKYALFIFIIPCIGLAIGASLESSKINNLTKYEINSRNENFSLEIICNRFFDLDFVFDIDPPIKFEHYTDLDKIASGYVVIHLMKKGRVVGREKIDIKKAGAYTSGGLWRKVIYHFRSSLFSFCEADHLNIFVENLDIDLNQHKVCFYITKDPRP